MKLRVAVMALAAASLAGCYTYAPVSIEAVSLGETVRARLTPEARARLPAQVRGDDGTLEGELLDRDGGALTLFVPTAVRQQGFFAEDLHERVRLPSADVVEVRRRQLDRPRTYALAAAGGAAVIGIAIETLTGKTGGNTIDRTTPGPSAARIPFFILHIR